MEPIDVAARSLGPLAAPIDKVAEILGHSPHPAIVMLPLGAWTVSNICDALGLITGKKTYDDAARLSMGIGLVGAAAAAATGLRDYSFIPKERPSHGVATAHALGNSVVASLFVASYVMRSRDHASGDRPSLASRVLALAGGGLSLYTAWLGGVLVENYGEGVEPMMESRTSGGSVESSDEPTRGRDRLAPEAPLGKHDEA